MLRFTVYGEPAPKGSAKGWIVRTKTGPRAVVTHASKKTKPWMQAIIDAARPFLEGELAQPQLEGPLALVLTFYMPRPKSLPKRVTTPATRPDLDKLVRCVKDGLTRAGVYRDDGQVAAMLANKAYAAGYADPDGMAGIPRLIVEVGPFRECAGVDWRWRETTSAPQAREEGR